MLLVFAIYALIMWGGDIFPTENNELKFTYHAFGGEDYFDQTLEINNTGLHAVVPTLKITPLDRFGAEIPGLTVSSVFGSERGGRVLPSMWSDWDVLKFEGERASEVRDVRVEVTHLEQVHYPETSQEVTVKRY